MINTVQAFDQCLLYPFSFTEYRTESKKKNRVAKKHVGNGEDHDWFCCLCIQNKQKELSSLHQRVVASKTSCKKAC